MLLAPLVIASGGLAPCARVGTRVKEDVQVVMRGLNLWMAAAAAACITGCANGGDGVTSPTPLAFATPTVPSSCAVPGTPGNLTAAVTGSSVSLSWSTVPDARDYVVIVGASPTDAGMQMTSSVEPRLTFENMEPGTHYARVHAHNWCGSGEASESIAFTIDD